MLRRDRTAWVPVLNVPWRDEHPIDLDAEADAWVAAWEALSDG
jgi:hypothetical protein